MNSDGLGRNRNINHIEVGVKLESINRSKVIGPSNSKSNSMQKKPVQKQFYEGKKKGSNEKDSANVHETEPEGTNDSVKSSPWRSAKKSLVSGQNQERVTSTTNRGSYAESRKTAVEQ